MDTRNADNVILTREMIDRAIMQIATSIPAVIESFDPSTMTVDATPAIDMKTYIDGEIQFNHTHRMGWQYSISLEEEK